jgi:hypothetical protein
VFAPIVLKQGIARVLTEHFAFFKNTPPLNRSSEAKTLQRLIISPLRIQTDQSYGIDQSQTRVIKLPGGNVDVITPGTEGLCETFSQVAKSGITASYGGCEDIQSVLRWGEFGISSTTGPTGSAYTLHGLIPNGNRTVIVKMVSAPN